jgi:hypothetical protein
MAKEQPRFTWQAQLRRRQAIAKGGIASRAVLVGTDVMAAKLEVVVDLAVGGEEALRMTP